MKKVLVLCTGNSCRSIIAEALLNDQLGHCLEAFSSGVKPSGRVNPNAKKVLEEFNIWKENYHSKELKTLHDHDFNLVITVCGNARETCPVFPGQTEVIHIGFEDPDGKEYADFIKTYHQIKDKLVPVVRDKLCG